MTAVIYARYSSDNQREESIEGQIRECTAYAEKNGITIVTGAINSSTLRSIASDSFFPSSVIPSGAILRSMSSVLFPLSMLPS